MATVMIVEDDETLNEVLQYNLERAGYRVIPVFDGAEAMRRIENEQPDLLLLDIMLPGADGWEVCRFLAKTPSAARIPVIFFTAKGTREDFDIARQVPNFAGYFTKPYATADVLRHVNKMLEEAGA